MKREIVHVELVTPCFLGGVNGAAEWRAASIRGELRWWFRTVAGPAFGGDLAAVRAAEVAVFGSTAASSCLAVRVVPPVPAPGPSSGEVPFGRRLFARQIARLWGDASPATEQRLRVVRDGNEVSSNPVHYLGYGPIDRGRLTRAYLPAGTPATFLLQWAPRPRGVSTELQAMVCLALQAWLDLGGIGARSRRGFGSLRRLGPNGAEDTRIALTTRAKELLALGAKLPGTPAWTCFSAGSRILVGESVPSWEAALERLGAWLVAFRRRYGARFESRPGLANRDYEWASPHGRLRQTPGLPDRAGFGLPLPFNERQGGDLVVWSGGAAKDVRRASPLLLHVARCGGEHVPVLTYLPAAFLPAGARVFLKGHKSLAAPPTPQQLDVITRFLDDLVTKQLVEEVR